MPMWRCPHCGTPQAETARCWVCRRSSTACGTCRNYRRSVAGSLGYCGLDRRRQPLAGDEIRPCWEAGPATAGDPVIAAARVVPPPAEGAGIAPPIEFVEVRDRSAPENSVTAGQPEAVPPIPIHPAAEPGWSLWGDPDR